MIDEVSALKFFEASLLVQCRNINVFHRLSILIIPSSIVLERIITFLRDGIYSVDINLDILRTAERFADDLLVGYSAAAENNRSEKT
jgi:hypothetical protein